MSDEVVSRINRGLRQYINDLKKILAMSEGILNGLMGGSLEAI